LANKPILNFLRQLNHQKSKVCVGILLAAMAIFGERLGEKSE